MNSRKQQSLDAIEEAFIELVLAEGFKKVSVLMIAKKAGINPKTFYNHYHDKNDLAQSLTDSFLAGYAAIFKERVRTYETLLHQQAPMLVQSWMNQQIHDPAFERRYKVLKLIQTPEVDFLAQFEQSLATMVLQTQITDDRMIAEVVAAVTIKVIDYYVETGETYSLERSQAMVETLRQLA